MDSSTKPNLYLVGFMGSGKSTVGRLAAQRLGLRFVDSDHAIEERAGRRIADIFATEGEAAFRAMERAFVEREEADSRSLVACGGGLVAQPGMMELVKAKGLVFALVASAEGIYERTKGNLNRPLLNVPDPLAEIRALLAKRAPFYDRADVQILTEGRSVADVVGHVCRTYTREAAQRARERRC